MKCKKCGKELKPGVKFCGFCGTPVEPEKSIDKKVWVLGAGGILLAVSIVGIVASGVLVKKPETEKKEAVAEGQDYADGGNKEEKKTETIYLPSKTTMYDADGNVIKYTVRVYQQNADGIIGEEITYPADEGRDALSEKKNKKYDKFGREEWEYTFQINDGEEVLSWLNIYEYKNDGSYYEKTRYITRQSDSEYVYHFDESDQVLASEYIIYDEESSSGFMGDTEWKTENIYDQDGKVSLVKTYDDNGKVKSTERYSYNENGKVVSTQSFDSDNRIIGRTEYNYDNSKKSDESGYKYTVIWYEGDEIVYRSEYTFDNDGRLYRQFGYLIEDGKETFNLGYEQTYDKEGNVASYTVFSDNTENIEEWTEYEYQAFEVDLLQNSDHEDSDTQEAQYNIVNEMYLPVKSTNLMDDGSVGFWEEYNYEKKNGQIIGIGKMYFKNTNGNQECVGNYSITYDGRGRLLEKTFYDTDSSYTDRMTYSYGEDGSYMEENEYMNKKIRRTYSKDHVLLSEDEYDSDSGEWVSAKIENEYDQNGNIVKHREYDENSRLTLEAEYIYDGNGKIGTIKSYDEQGNVLSVSQKVYDQNGNMLQSTKEENGVTTEVIYQRYDSYGNLLFYEKYGKTGKLVSASKTEYQMFPLENQ